MGKDYHNIVSDVRVLREDKSYASGGLNTEVPWLWPFLTNTHVNHLEGQVNTQHHPCVLCFLVSERLKRISKLNNKFRICFTIFPEQCFFLS